MNIQNFQKPLNITEFTSEPSLIGLNLERLKPNNFQVEVHNMKSLTQLRQEEFLSVMLGFLHTLKKNISNHKQNFCYFNTLLLNWYLKLGQVLTLNEKNYGILWNGSLQEISNKLWSHIKIDSQDLDLSLSKKSVPILEQKSWFSTNKQQVLSQNSYKISLPSFMSSHSDYTDYESINKNSRIYRIKTDKNQSKLFQFWSITCKKIYNEALKFLNDKQGFDSLGKAKGTKSQQFQTLSMRTWVKCNNIPAKIIHSTLQRAWVAWSSTKVNKNKLRLAEYFTGDFTIQTDPKAYRKGKLYPKFWGNLQPLTLRYNHKDQQIIGNNCLTIFRKFGKWYLSQPCEYKRQPVNTKEVKVIGLDPGLRNFLTGFDGQNFLQFTTPKNAERLIKISKYISKLISKKKSISCNFHRRMISFKIERLRKKSLNLKKELLRKIACWISKNYDVIFLPEFKIKSIFSKRRNNKTNNLLSRLLSHFEFKTLLAYHCAKNGSVMVSVNEAYTSKTCSRCGHIHSTLSSNKLFVCPKCNHTLDRDCNSAINILNNSLTLC